MGDAAIRAGLAFEGVEAELLVAGEFALERRERRFAGLTVGTLDGLRREFVQATTSFTWVEIIENEIVQKMAPEERPPFRV